ncbi:MAG: PorT family protein [Bacteroidetes bacterium]|nr:PorT family protein [Bacteroidota bacterium]
MKKTVYVLVIFFFYQIHGYAQNIALGFRGGISIPNLTAGSGNQNPLNTGYSSRLGPEASVFADFKFSELFSLQPMIEYSSQGGKKNGLQAFTTPDELKAMFPEGQAPQYLYANYKSEAKMNYILLPVLAKFSRPITGSRFTVYVDAGPFVGLLVSAHQVTSGQSDFYTDAAGTQPLPGGAQSFDANTNVRNSLHKFNAGIEGNLGLSYTIARSVVFIEGGGNYGFLNIQKNAVDGKNETGAAVATIGYSYWFGK